MSAYTDALGRLRDLYNDGAYDVVDNPGGFDNNGHRTNFINALRDVATIASALEQYSAPQCRLTLTSGTPFMRTSVAGATRVFLTPTGGESMPVATSAGVIRVALSEIYQDTTDTTKSPAAVIANANYDMLFWSDPGTGLCVSRSDYWKKSAAVTMTIASPAVVTWAGNSFADGTPFVLSTTGALPTGLTAGTTYFVKQTTLGVIADTFRLSATPGGSAINTSGSQSGVHTATVGEDVPLVARGSGGNCEIVWNNGLPFNKNAITNGPGAGMGLVVGSVGSNSSATIDFIYGGLGSGGLAGVFMVSNAFNPELIASFTGDSSAVWNPTSTAWRAGNNSATMRCSFLRCFDLGMVRGKYKSLGTPAAGNLKIGVGLDSTTSFSGSSGLAASTTLIGEMNADYAGQPGLGRHFISGNEIQSSASASAFYGNAGGPSVIQSGLHTELWT